MTPQAWPRRHLAAAAAAVLACVAVPARATAAPTPNAVYAGGAFTSAAPLVGVRVGHTARRVAFEGEAISRCAGGERVDERLTVFTPIAASGSFRGRAQRTFRLTAAESRTVTLSVAGAIADTRRASGRFSMEVLVRRRGRPTIRCASGLQRWEARSVRRVPPGPARPRVGAGYYGRTSQRARFVVYPFALRVSGLGMQVEGAAFRVRRTCTGVLSGDVPADMPAAPIRPDGTFTSTERHSQRFPDAVEEFSFTLTGRFTTLGAGGTLRATSTVRDLRTGRVIGRCSSGTVSWRAML